MAEAVGQGAIEEFLSSSALCNAGESIYVSNCESFLDVSDLGVLLHCNSGASSCVTHDIGALATDEGSERVEFRGVRDCSDVDGFEVVRLESHLWKRAVVAALLFFRVDVIDFARFLWLFESSVPLPVVRLCDRVTGFLNKSAKTASMPYFCVRSDDEDELHAL